MRTKARFWGVASLFLVVNAVGLYEIRRAVSQRHYVTVESFRPEGRVEPQGKITVRFSEPMVPAQELGKPVTTAPVTFEPAIPGRFEWKNPRTLRFLPDKPLPRATAFVATLSEDLMSLAGHPLADDAVFSFHTPPLELVDVTQIAFSRRGETTLALEFNDKVEPQQVARHLKLESPGGRTVKYDLHGRAPSRRVVVRTRPFHERKLVVKLSAGLRGQSGPMGIEDEVRRVVDLHSALTIRRVNGSAPGPGRVHIQVRCTQSVETKSVHEHVELEPAVPFSVTHTWSGFELHGDFQPGSRYRVTFRKGLEATNAAVLANDVARSVTIPDYRPSLSFQTHGFYLSSEGSLLVPLQTINLDKIELIVRKCYANNVVHYLREMDDEDDVPGGFGREVARKTYTFDAKPNEVVRTNVDLRSLLAEQPQGVYHLMAEDVEERWRDCTKLVLITDLGLSVKRSPTDVLVWVNALSTSQPVAGATVSVFSRTNQPLARGVTNEQGIAHFTNESWADERTPFLVAASKGADVAFVELAKGEWDNSALGTGGRPYLRRGYEAFLYTDRGIYRPGATVHLRAIVRGPGAVAPQVVGPLGFPVQFRINRPDGRRFKTFNVKLSRWGTAEVDIELPAWARLGRYTAELRLPQGKESLGAKKFLVEEFVPDRMRLDLAAEDRRYRGGETITVTVKAKHLFGAPAAGRRVTVRCKLMATDFELDDAKGFRFADSTRNFEAINENLGRQTLDENGEATFTLEVPTKLRPPSALTALFVATVHEIGGRAITASLARDVDAYPHYVGLTRELDGAVEPRKSQRFLVKVVRPDGTPVPDGTLNATLHRVVWNTVLRRDREGRYRYQSEREERKVAAAACTVTDGSGSLSFTPPSPGLYRVRVEDKAAGVAATLTFHCTGYGYVPWAREKPERLELVPDKERYAPGETARVLIKAPFGGQALVTVESDRVHLARTITLEKNTGEFSFPVKAAYGPNVYCTVAVIRRIRPGAKWAPHRAFGTVSILLDHSPRKLNVEVASPAQTRPGGPLRIALRVRDAAGKGVPAEITLAAVDEGICQLTRFRTPDPWAFFYGKRELGVTTSDVYSLLMPEVDKKKVGSDSAPGGGGPGEEEARRLLNPIRAERVKTVALWKSSVQTADDGTAEVVLDVPRFSGQLRVMAVAVGQSDFGAAERPVLVKQPLLIRTTFPRFLSPGDEFDVPVAVFNHTKQSGAVKLAIEGSPGIEFSPDGEQTVDVEKGREGSAVFHVRAPSVPGTVKLTVTATLGAETATEEVEIAVRPPATLRFVSGSGAIEAGQTAKFTVPGGWIPGTAKYSLAFASLPGIKLGRSLRYVVRYPYGCVEQTTSSALPLLYLNDVAALADPDTFDGDSVEPYVQAGIARVLSMQTYEGGFGYWPGASDTYPWGSAYATHFLVEARKAGYAVYKDNLDTALGYLAGYLKSAENTRNTLPVKAYACFVLALAGKPNPSWAYRRYEQRDQLPAYARCHLAAALALDKKPKLVQALIGSVPLPSASDHVDTGGLLHSSTREDAILLSVYTDIDPSRRNIPELIRRIEKAMKDGRWRSTQENAFVLMALGKYLRRRGKQDTDFLAEVSVNGEHLTKLTHNDRVRLTPEKLGGREVTVAVEGKGTLYYYWTAEGVPVAGEVPEFDSGLKIRRQLLTRDGKPLDPLAIPHGEVVVVDLTIRAERRVENVAISDLLPAGFEIENPRLATSEILAAGEATSGRAASRERARRLPALEPDRVEMRDDRLLLFTDLGRRTTRHYRYVGRAETKGTFALPPVSASCMYDPSIASTHGAGHIQVIGE